MQKSSDGSNNFDEAMAGNPRTAEPVIGDADNVQKTTYVAGRGTDPDAGDPTPLGMRKGDTDTPVAARVQGGSGPNVLLWLVIAAVLAIALFYIF